MLQFWKATKNVIVKQMLNSKGTRKLCFVLLQTQKWANNTPQSKTSAIMTSWKAQIANYMDYSATNLFQNIP